MFRIITARMEHSKENGYVGQVDFEYEGHQSSYTVTLQSKDGRDWGYSLLFLSESGSEEEIEAVEELLEEDDEAFDQLVEAAMSKLGHGGNGEA